MIPLRDDNPTTIKPLVTLGFIVLCSLVFLWQLSLGANGFRAAVISLGVIPATLSAARTSRRNLPWCRRP